MSKQHWTAVVAALAAGLALVALLVWRRGRDNEVEADMRSARIPLIVSALAITGLIIIAIFTPCIAGAGWLLGLTYVAAFPLGSLAWLMIHRLTGGRWGEALEPFLLALAQLTPLLLLLVIPALVAIPVLFPWVGSHHGISPSVHAIYLNISSYAVRSLLALAGWSVLAFVVPSAPRRIAPLVAGIGLLFHAIAVSFVAQDWLLAAEPPFISTSFGASVAFTQLLAALALAAILAPRHSEFPDLGSLILVVTLGITYTDFMAVLVMWYGDVPSKVFWFAERIEEPWRALAIAIFIITSAIPIVLLMFARVRVSRAALRGIGILSLTGLAFYQAWLLAPAFGPAALGTGLLALVAMAGILAAATIGGWLQDFSYRWRTADGH